jgi:peptidoglycan/LPS O-acetylase OafA/YrhL
MRNERLKELDALRGIASVMVVMFHFSMGRPQSEPVLKYFVTGVDLFFIISGFVIFMSLEHIRSVKEFAINRFTRLFPAFWLCLCLTFAFRIFHTAWQGIPPETGISGLLANMTMFPFYFGQPELDGTYWTLAVEMLFNFSWPWYFGLASCL